MVNNSNYYFREKSGMFHFDRFDEPTKQIAVPSDPSLKQLPDLTVCAIFAEEIETQLALAKVTSIRPVDYGWNGGSSAKVVDQRSTLEANSPDGTRKAVVEEKSIKIVDRNRQRLVARIKTDQSIREISFTPKGTRIVVKFDDGSYQCFDSRSYADRQTDRDHEFKEQLNTRDFLNTLLASPIPNSELFESILDDKKMSLTQKSVLGGRLSMELDSIKSQAAKLFRDISEDCLTMEEVREKVSEQESSNPMIVNRYNLRSYLAGWNRANATTLNAWAWRVVLNRSSLPESYHRALRNVLVAVSESKSGVDSLYARDTLGVAYYRTQQYEQSITELESLEKECISSKTKLFFSSLAFLAMSHFQLGNKEAAQKYFDRLLQMRVELQEAGGLTAEFSAFFDEAKALISP